MLSGEEQPKPRVYRSTNPNSKYNAIMNSNNSNDYGNGNGNGKARTSFKKLSLRPLDVPDEADEEEVGRRRDWGTGPRYPVGPLRQTRFQSNSSCGGGGDMDVTFLGRLQYLAPPLLVLT
jgi:hypothetical protein